MYKYASKENFNADTPQRVIGYSYKRSSVILNFYVVNKVG